MGERKTKRQDAKRMKKFKSILICFLLIINAISGYFTYLYFSQEPEIKIVEKTKVEYEIKYREYDTLNMDTCLKELKKYDTGKPSLDGEMRSNNIFYAEAGLNGRAWNREFKLKVHEQGNWKFYIAAGVIGATAGGYMLYRIMK